MKTGHTTIKDIARELNISPSTVSRALRNHPDISAETKTKVAAQVEELDYHPNLIATSLQKSKTNTIGIIVPEIRHDFFSTVISGIEDVCYESDYTIMVCQSNENSEKESRIIKALVSNRVDGLMISISQTTKDPEPFLSLKRQNVPFVFFDRVIEDIEASKVVVDDFAGAEQAVEHLISRGYKRIAHLAGPKYISISKDRLKGYQSALTKHSIPYQEKLVIHGGFSENDGIIGLQKLSQLPQLPDAIFAVNDPVSIGVFMQIKEMGLKIPDDIALIGFSDNPNVSLTEPPLSTVQQPAYEMGQISTRLLLEQIENKKDFLPRIEKLTTKLIIRKST